MRQSRVGVFLQPLAVRLADLIAVAQQPPRHAEEAGHRAVFQCVVFLAQHLFTLHEGGDLVPYFAVVGLQLGVGGHLLAQRLFAAPELAHEDAVGQRAMLAFRRLQPVFEAPQQVHGMPLLFSAAVLVFGQQAAHLRSEVHLQGQTMVPLVDQLRHRHAARGTSRVARDEDRFALAQRALRPREVVVHRLGQAIAAVDPDEGHVQVVARKGEVVGVAAEEGHALFRGEGQADVLEAPILVQVIAPAEEEADDLATEFVGRRAMLLDGGEGCLLGLGEGCRGHVAGGVLHAGGDVGDLHQLVDFHRGATRFLGRRAGLEPIAVVVLLALARDRAHAIPHAVVVGHHQATGRHHRGRATPGNAHRRQAQVV
jgi:hypothetical protein